MAQDNPTAAELLEAVRDYLLEDALPALDGRAAFHARVAANVVGIVAREITLGPAADRAERARLLRLLSLPESDARSLTELNALVAQQIRAGLLDDRRDELVAHLRATVGDKLRIANPSHLEGT